MHLDVLRSRTELASTLPFHRSYAIFSWLVESFVLTCSTNSQPVSRIQPMFSASLAACEFCLRITARAAGVRLFLPSSARLATAAANHLAVAAGDRANALTFIRAWVEASVEGYIKICDPFFGPDDLEVLKIFLSTDVVCRVLILTSVKHQKQKQIAEPWRRAYNDRWREMSDLEPPETDVTIVGTRSGGELPIHDRWWLSRSAGLRFGTSFNSLGTTKHSEISVLSSDQVAGLDAIVDPYLNRTKREHNGERLQLEVFSLD
jgi:hypothetical protein